MGRSVGYWYRRGRGVLVGEGRVALATSKEAQATMSGPISFGSIVGPPTPAICWQTNESEGAPPARRARAQEELTVNFDVLHERARERGWTLTKSNVAARYGTMPIRFILRDKHGLIHFRNLDEVERRLNAKAKQS